MLQSANRGSEEDSLLQAIYSNDAHTTKSIFENRTDLVETYFLQRCTGGSISGTPLHIAAACKSFDVIQQLLIEFNAKVNKVNRKDDERNVLHYWADTYVPTTGHRLQSSPEIDTQFLELILSLGFDLNQTDVSGQSPLFTTVTEGNLVLTKLLLDHGANAQIFDKNNETPLHVLPIRGSNFELAKLLLTHGCNCRVKSGSQRVALHRAAEFGTMADAAILMINSGAKINVQDKWSTMPIHFAARWGNYAVLKKLIEHGADILAPIDAQHAPLELSRYIIRDSNLRLVDGEQLHPVVTTPLQLARFFDISDDPDWDDEELAIPRVCETVMLSTWSRYQTWRTRYNFRVCCGLLQEKYSTVIVDTRPLLDADENRAIYAALLQRDIAAYIESFLGVRDPWGGLEDRNRQVERRWFHERRNAALKTVRAETKRHQKKGGRGISSTVPKGRSMG